MKKNNISYTLDLTGPDPEIEIDAEKIQQLFLHLFKNAVEAMTRGGTLTDNRRSQPGIRLGCDQRFRKRPGG